MFADDICVFCPSVRGMQSTLDVCQAYAGSHEIIFNCSETACMMFKAKTVKSTVIPLLTMGVLSGVFKERRASHLPRASPAPLSCYAGKFSLFLMKNVLFTHIMYYKTDHK